MKNRFVLIPGLLVGIGLIAGFVYLETVHHPHVPRATALAPEETLFFAHLPDLNRTRTRWKFTALRELWQEPEMQEFWEKPRAKLQAESPWFARLTALEKVGAREVFVAVTSLDGPMPQFVAGFAFSGSRASAEALLAEPRAALRKAWPAGKADLVNYGPLEVETFRDKDSVMAGAFRDNWYFFANNLELLERTLDRYDHKNTQGALGGNLGGSAAFVSATAPLSADCDALLFARLDTVTERLSGLLSASGQSAEPLEGFKKMKALAASTKLDGKEFRDTIFLLSPGSAPEPALERRSLAMTGADTLLYSALRLPAAIELPEPALALAVQYVPALEAMQKALADKGITQAGLRGALGPEWSLWLDWPAAADSEPSVFMALDVRQALPVRALAEALASGVAWVKTEQDGVTLYSAPADGEPGLMAPALALTDKCMLLGLNAQALLPTLQRLGPGASSAPGLPAAAQWVRTPEGAFAYVDLQRLFARGYRTFKPFVIMSLAFTTEAGQYIDAGKLPEAETIAKHLGTMVFSQSSTEQGTLLESAGTLTLNQALLGAIAASLSAALPGLQDGVSPAHLLPGFQAPAPAPPAQPAALSP